MISLFSQGRRLDAAVQTITDRIAQMEKTLMTSITDL